MKNPFRNLLNALCFYVGALLFVSCSEKHEVLPKRVVEEQSLFKIVNNRLVFPDMESYKKLKIIFGRRNPMS